jgi:chromosome segregation ATPase
MNHLSISANILNCRNEFQKLYEATTQVKNTIETDLNNLTTLQNAGEHLRDKDDEVNFLEILDSIKVRNRMLMEEYKVMLPQIHDFETKYQSYINNLNVPKGPQTTEKNQLKYMLEDQVKLLNDEVNANKDNVFKSYKLLRTLKNIVTPTLESKINNIVNSRLDQSVSQLHETNKQNNHHVPKIEKLVENVNNMQHKIDTIAEDIGEFKETYSNAFNHFNYKIKSLASEFGNQNDTYARKNQLKNAQIDLENDLSDFKAQVDLKLNEITELAKSRTVTRY